MVSTPDSPEWADPAKRSTDETRFAADMIRYTDKVVGRVVQKIDELGIRDNTLILFFSDNGTNWRVASMLGDRRVRGGKGRATDLGIRVPMMASWKGVTRAGQVSTDLIDSVDFLPTILDAAGAADLIPKPIDGASFLPTLTGNGASARQWVYIHQDPRPGWDKDRFALIRLARDQSYKLYEDGRLFCTRDDPLEESPIFLRDDSDESRAARAKLQKVLDSMKPYPIFDPDQMPRPNPSDSLVNHEFHDQGGYIVAETEMIPTPRDESWLAEASLTDYTGTGYLRALRDQPTEPERGAAVVRVNAATAGEWNLAVRCRSDHHTGQVENEIWVKVGDGPWLVGTTNNNAGQWQWVTELTDPKSNQRVEPRFVFTEKRNEITIAPRSHNLKIDRIVCYEDDRGSKATDPRTPASEFHPWASP